MSGQVGASPAAVSTLPAAAPIAAGEAADRGLAQVLAAALWEAEPEGERDTDGPGGAHASPPPLPSTVPGLMDPDDPSYAASSLSLADLERVTTAPPRLTGRAPAPREEPPLAAAPPPGATLETPPAWLLERFAELARLQTRQAEHTEKLYAENQSLRAGELLTAMEPLILGLTKLTDQMSLLAAGEAPGGSASLLRRQLLQVLENTVGVVPFEVEAGETFDVGRQRGVRAIDTTEAELAGRVSATVRPGFLRADGSVVRVAEVEVLRHRPAAEPTGNTTRGVTPATPPSADGK